MAHPFAAHRANEVAHRRVGHLTKGYGAHSIGKPHRADHHEDAGEDRAMIKAMVKPGALKHKAHGGKSVAPAEAGVKHRLDKPHRAKGGRVKHAKTNVNVIVGHGGQQPPMPIPVPAAPPPVAAVPRPPMPAPGMAPGMAPGIGPGMPPPGGPMGPRKSGGRTYAKGGRVGRMPGYESTRKHATQVQHTDGKFPYEKRGRQITYKRGGVV